MQFRNTVIALILLALIGGYAYYTSRHPSSSEGKPLLHVKPEDIAKIDLRYPDREIELELNREGKWTITKPLRVDADQTTASSLARDIANVEVRKTILENAKDLAPFGLDRPKAVVTITLKNNKQLPAIEVGKSTPVGFSTYIKTADKPTVFLTSSTFASEVTKNLDDLRDRTLIAASNDQVNKIVLERPSQPKIELEKHDGEWKIVAPRAYPADSSEVASFVGTLTGGRIDRFVSDAPKNLADYGLDKPQLTVSIYVAKDKTPQTLEFGKATSTNGTNGYYAKRASSESVYTVPDWIFKDINKQVNDFRDKTVLAFDPSKVGKVEIQNGTQKFTLEQDKDGKWRIENGVSEPADNGLVIQFLSNLRNLKGNAIVAEPAQNLKDFGLDQPAMQLALSDTAGKSIGSVKLGKVPESQTAAASTSGAASPTPTPAAPTYDYYATSSGTQAVFKIESYSFDDLNKTPDQLKAKPASAASKKS